MLNIRTKFRSLLARYSHALLILALVLVASMSLNSFFARFGEYMADDAYIHIRNARNLLNYGQPYFNVGEPVFSSSSPLYLVLIATLFLIFDVDPMLLLHLNALICVLAVLVFGKILSIELQGMKSASLMLSTICVLGWLMTSAQRGMETPLALLIFGFSLLLLLKRRPEAFFFLAISVFCRYELWAAMPIYLVASRRYRLVHLGKALLAFALGVTPLAGLCFWKFGTLIPNTVTAKAIVYQGGMFNFSLFLPLQEGVGRLVLIGYIGLAVILSCPKLSKVDKTFLALTPGAFCLLLLGGMIFLVYGLMGALVMPWYVPLYSVPLTVAAVIASSYSKRSGITVLFWVIFLYLPSLKYLNGAHSWTSLSSAEVFAEGARTRRYINLGQLLYAQFPKARLLAAEIGGLGYAFKGYIIDGIGLVTPAALRYHPVPFPDRRPDGFSGAIPVELIDQLRPELIAAYDRFNFGFLGSVVRNDYCRFELPVFLDEDMKKRPEGIWQTIALPFWVRKDLLDSLSKETYVCPHAL